MRELCSLTHQVTRDRIVANAFPYLRERSGIGYAHLGKALLPDRSPEPKLASRSKREPALDELHSPLDAQAPINR